MCTVHCATVQTMAVRVLLFFQYFWVTALLPWPMNPLDVLAGTGSDSALGSGEEAFRGLPCFQELVLELELERRRGLAGGCQTREHFLLRVFRERLLALGTGAALGARLLRQQELLSQTR